MRPLHGSLLLLLVGRRLFAKYGTADQQRSWLHWFHEGRETVSVDVGCLAACCGHQPGQAPKT